MSGYKFRVLIDSEKQEEIFRDIWISGSSNFESFYNTIIKSFGFSGQELASFYVSNDDWDKGEEISSMDMSFGEEDDANAPAMMTTSFLDEYTKDEDQKFLLVYDFMRMWIFLIELIETTEEAPAEPEIILSVGESPQETDKDFTDGQFVTVGAGVGNSGDGDDYGFDDMDDGFDESEFDNIDDYDI